MCLKAQSSHFLSKHWGRRVTITDLTHSSAAFPTGMLTTTRAWRAPGLLDIFCKHQGFTVNFFSRGQEATYSDGPHSYFAGLEVPVDPSWCWEQCGSRCVTSKNCLPFDVLVGSNPCTHRAVPSTGTSRGTAPWPEWGCFSLKGKGKGCQDFNSSTFTLSVEAKYTRAHTHVCMHVYVWLNN